MCCESGGCEPCGPPSPMSPPLAQALLSGRRTSRALPPGTSFRSWPCPWVGAQLHAAAGAAPTLPPCMLPAVVSTLSSPTPTPSPRCRLSSEGSRQVARGPLPPAAAPRAHLVPGPPDLSAGLPRAEFGQAVT